MTDKISSNKKLLINAQCMYESAQTLSGKLNLSGGNTAEDGANFVGSVVLYAFSIELFLKALISILNEGEFPKEHSLKLLFDSIPDKSIRKNIAQTYKLRTNEELDIFLSENKSSFTEWRYFFESRSNLQFNVSGATALLEVVAPIAVGLDRAKESNVNE